MDNEQTGGVVLWAVFDADGDCWGRPTDEARARQLLAEARATYPTFTTFNLYRCEATP